MAKKITDASSTDAQMNALKLFLGKNQRLLNGFAPNNLGHITCRITSQTEIRSLLTPLESALYGGNRAEFFRRVVKKVLEASAENDEKCALYSQFKGKLLTNSILLAKLLAHILSTPELITQLLSFLPEKAVAVLRFLTLEQNSAEVGDVEKTMDVQVFAKALKNYYDKPDVMYAFLLFSFKRGEYNYYKKHSYSQRMYLPVEVRACFRRYFLSGEDPLTPLEAAPKGTFRYNNEAYITKHAPVLWSFMNTGQLKYSSTNDKPLKNSLRAMNKLCGLPEFFPPTMKELDALAAQLIVTFLENCTHQENVQTPLDYLQYWYQQFDKAKFPIREGVLWMLKEERHGRLLNRIDQGLIELLCGLPKKGFVGAEGLRNYVLLHLEKFSLVPEDQTQRRFFLNATPAYLQENRYSSDMPIREEHYFDAVVMTAVRGMIFFFAALGMVEIVYDEPLNKLLQNGAKDYVSPFDSLVAVQITPLGRYLTGAEKKYKVGEGSQEATFEVFFDEQVLLAAVHADDKIRLMSVEKFMRPIALGSQGTSTKKESPASTTNTDTVSNPPLQYEPQNHRRYFKMSYDTFLENCSTVKQVEDKITLFRSQICSPKQQLPALWEDFFKDIIARAQPLKRTNTLIAYTVKPSPELTRLLSSDVILKKIVIRAEGYRILVSRDDAYTLIRRLRTLGYLMNDKENY